MPELRLAVVGAGFMAQTAHIRCFQLAQGAQVVGLASGRPHLREQVARRFGIARQYGSWEEVAADPQIDAVVVSLPPEYNPDVCCGLLEAGKHVFAEKPMALSVAQAERMAETSGRTGRLLMIGFMKRYDSGVQRAKAWWDEHVATGEMGNLVCGRAWCLLGGNWTANIERLVEMVRTDEPQAPKPVADTGPDWLPAALAAGMPGFASPYYFFNHVHSHNVNLLRHFCGDGYEVIHADLRHRTRLAHIAYGDAVVTLEVGTGISAHGFEEGLRLYLEKATIEVLPPPPLLMQGGAEVRIFQGGDVQEFQQPMGEWDWSFRRQAQEFVDCVREGREPVTAAADSVGDLRMVEDIFRCAIDRGLC
ncbi:MAG: Gfo/Idh/MocA family oxidoreductase [Armatimonadetes bacterium]|nr:Gfo/Idh/MocA family oxidoreductase [Armatimonadota bacterium]